MFGNIGNMLETLEKCLETFEKCLETLETFWKAQKTGFRTLKQNGLFFYKFHYMFRNIYTRFEIFRKVGALNRNIATNATFSIQEIHATPFLYGINPEQLWKTPPLPIPKYGDESSFL